MKTRPVLVGLLVALGIVALLLLVMLSLIACSSAEEPKAAQATDAPKVDPATLALKVDPYCGMSVEKHPIAATYAYKGKTYGFCSDFCKDAFAKEPEKWLANVGKGTM